MLHLLLVFVKCARITVYIVRSSRIAYHVISLNYCDELSIKITEVRRLQTRDEVVIRKAQPTAEYKKNKEKEKNIYMHKINRILILCTSRRFGSHGGRGGGK